MGEYYSGPFDEHRAREKAEKEMSAGELVSGGIDPVAVGYGVSSAADESFEFFFNMYPDKSNKIRAKAAWIHAGCHKIYEKIHRCLHNQIQNCERFKAGFHPTIINYIGGERWNDAIQQKPKSSFFNHDDSSWADSLQDDSATSINKHFIELINQLFRRIVSICPAFKTAWPTESDFFDTKRVWFITLTSNHVASISELQKGLDRLASSDTPFVPSPGQFLKWCQLTPQDLGLPSAPEAFRIASKYAMDFRYSPSGTKKPHITIHSAATLCGFHDLTQHPASKMLPIFEEFYLVVCKNFSKGELREAIEDKICDNFANQQPEQESRVIEAPHGVVDEKAKQQYYRDTWRPGDVLPQYKGKSQKECVEIMKQLLDPKKLPKGHFLNPIADSIKNAI